MTFFDQLAALDLNDLRARITDCTAADVERALTRDRLGEDDVLALFSPAADPYLELLAQRSAAITERRFGKVVHLFNPLYVSNYCVNRCKYCGFAHNLEVERSALTPAEAMAEAQIIYDMGFRHILLVSGESRQHVPMEYLTEVAGALHKKFASVSVEIFPLTTEEYRQLNAAGVDGLTMFQETYDPELYKIYHPAGPKRNYQYRLEAMDRGGEAGLRSLGLGSLLGLNDWRFESVCMAMHGRYLLRKYWRSKLGISFPRIREAAGHFRPEHPVSDRDLVHMICAMRIVFPDADLVLSTREPARLRDRLIGLGVTRVSAGSRTNPGGYGHEEAGGKQFEISDPRSPAEIAAMLESKGFEPVWKDFDSAFLSA